MHRYFVTGTDTDVGKTRVTAALAAALRAAGETPTIVKAVQTGVAPQDEGDAAHAARLAGVRHVELLRFQRPADPWSAALAQKAKPPRAAELAARIDAIPGAVIVEGAGGAAVPLNETETFADLASAASLPALLVVGLRLGCISHSLLTIAFCEQRRIPVAGCVLVNRWEDAGEAYTADVRRALQGKAQILGILPFDRDERAAVERDARIFAPLLQVA